MSSSPVHFDAESSAWYFWDETWADRIGPFETEKECQEALEKYCDYLEQGPQ